MSRHDEFVCKSWAELLARKDIIGGNLYFVEGGRKYVGRITRVDDRGSNVVFQLAWCGYETKLDGWTRRHRICATRLKARLELPVGSGPIKFGEDVLHPKGQDPFEETDLRKPLSREARREARRRQADAEGPGPLFAARPK